MDPVDLTAAFVTATGRFNFTPDKKRANSVGGQQVTDVQLDPEGQTDGELAVRYDQRRRLQSKRVENEGLDVISQRPAFPEDVPSTVEEDVTHPSVVRNGEEEILPVHGFWVTKDAIDDVGSRPQIRVFVVTFGGHDEVPARNGLEHGLVEFATNTLALDGGALAPRYLSLGITTGRPDEQPNHSSTVL